MEMLNKVELKGRVGRVSINQYGDKRAANYSVAVHEEVKDRNGATMIEITWFNCIAWEGEEVDLSSIDKGVGVHVIGRFRARRYTAADGSERIAYDVKARMVKCIA